MFRLSKYLKCIRCSLLLDIGHYTEFELQLFVSNYYPTPFPFLPYASRMKAIWLYTAFAKMWTPT